MKRSSQLLFDPGAGTGSASKIVSRIFGMDRFCGMISPFWRARNTALLGLAGGGDLLP